MRLQDKVAIITGAGSGFGEGMARRFADEGAKIIVADINVEGGQRVTGEIGDAAHFIHADVSSATDAAAMVGAAQEVFGGLDILVNNAGYTHRRGPMLEVPEDVFDRIFAVNVKAIYLAALHAVPVFQAAGGGVILNIASTAGVRPRPGLTWYNGSKGAAITLTKSMAVELAPDKIRVCAINPVAGETGLLEKFMGEDTPEIRQQFTATIPLGRFSQPLDIANAALYLCSDEAEFMTGVCLEVDGGRCV
ncbi:MAG: SDR family oxidoreductase [Rhodospirillaceae bacterium]|jgi:3-oxoacyl-[acyl-carrier protein] reductase|nr:SDR family oxidoreductase [Rhodospirillaceae bacterium]